MIVLKIGGALLTEKEGYCTPNLATIAAYGHALSKVVSQHGQDIIIVLGGGSFGNGVPLRYNITAKSSPDLHDISRMTVAMMQWMSIVVEAWREFELPLYPFQASSIIYIDQNNEAKGFLEPVNMAIESGLIPIISGDLIFHKNGTRSIFSSDFIPAVLSKSIQISKVVMLSDVAGLLDYSLPSKPLIRRVRTDERVLIQAAAGRSSKPDFTGGMSTKVEALSELALLGIGGLIADGRVPERLESILSPLYDGGTLFEPAQIPRANEQNRP